MSIVTKIIQSSPIDTKVFLEEGDSGTLSSGIEAGGIVSSVQQGIRGPVGPAGAAGPQGSTGPAGIDGVNGVNGSDGLDGREVELQKSVTHVQWRYVGDVSWTDLILLSEITGPQGTQGVQGETGPQGPTGVQGIQGNTGPQGPAGAQGVQGPAGTNGTDGTDGREVELQSNGTHIQWRYAGDVSWTNVIALSSLQGPQGIQGVQGIQGETGATGPAGPAGQSGNGVLITCDFGPSFTDKAQTVVTGQPWVASGSKITCDVLTPSGVDPDEMYLLNIRPVVSNLVAGTGFTVTLYSEAEAKGQYSVMCIGI